jgi:hypothetical protein
LFEERILFGLKIDLLPDHTTHRVKVLLRGGAYALIQRIIHHLFSGIPGGLTPGRFTGFTLPAAGTLLCTKWAGLDKMLGTGDDICEAFSYPSCMAGQSVSAVLAAANQQLALGSNALVQASRC